MSEALIAAVFAGVGGLIGVLGKVIVDVIKAKKEPDESDLRLKEEVDQQKEEFKNSLMSLVEKVDKGFEKVNADNQGLNDMLVKTQKNQEVSIRHSITEVYYKYCREKKFPHNVKQDICFLFAAYEQLGGNSYVHELYDEMMTWEAE